MMHYSKEDWRNYTLDFIENNKRDENKGRNTKSAECL